MGRRGNRRFFTDPILGFDPGFGASVHAADAKPCFRAPRMKVLGMFITPRISVPFESLRPLARAAADRSAVSSAGPARAAASRGTDQLADPVEVLFGVQLGGGTDI